MVLKTILIADDEESLRILVRTTLEDQRNQILEASDGAEALRLAKEKRPDLLVLDWNMPKMTGPEVIKELRGDAETAEIPFILLTAASQGSDRTTGLKLGALAYLVKPFSPLQLLHAATNFAEKVLRGAVHRHFLPAEAGLDPAKERGDLRVGPVELREAVVPHQAGAHGNVGAERCRGDRRRGLGGQGWKRSDADDG